MLGSGMNLVTTVIGFGMSFTFIVFFCARLICGRIRSADSQAAAFNVERHSDVDPPEHSINGLEPVVVAAIPMIKYNRETFHSGEDAQCLNSQRKQIFEAFRNFYLHTRCTICLGEYQEREILRIMPTCGHNFHLTCIDEWLHKQSTCPICRLSLNDLIETKDAALQAVSRHEVSSGHANQRLLHSHELSGESRNNQDT